MVRSWGFAEFLVCEPGDFIMYLGTVDTSQDTYKPLHAFWHLRYRTRIWIMENWIRVDTKAVDTKDV